MAFVIFLSASDSILASATLSLSPSVLSIPINTSFDIDVLLSTGPDSVNFVSANLDFPKDKLTVESFDESNTVIALWPEKTYVNELGRINLAGAIYNPGVNGTDLKIIRIRFKAVGKSGDSALVTFKPSSEVFRLSDTTDILGSKVNGTYTFSSGSATTPQPTTPPSPTSTLQTPTPQLAQPTLAQVTPTLTPSLTGGGIASASPTLFFTPTPSESELPQTGRGESLLISGIGFSLFMLGLFILSPMIPRKSTSS